MSEPLVFIHLSDIHFNKKWMDHYDLDRDLRNQIEKDVSRMKPKFASIKGILVSGDVAFGGKKEQCAEGRSWLRGASRRSIAKNNPLIAKNASLSAKLGTEGTSRIWSGKGAVLLGTVCT